MITLAITYSVYLFLCYGFDTKPTPHGLFLPFIVWFLLAMYQAIREDKEVNIYLTKEQVDRLSEASEELDNE